MSASAPVDVETHLASVLAEVAPLESAVVPIGLAAGRVTSSVVRAMSDIPRFDNAKMDGYAVRAADVAGASEAAPARLAVVAEVAAGSPEDPPIGPGEAVRIMTGAALPSDADAVVPVERTAGFRNARAWADIGASVDVLVPVAAGADVRRTADDVAAGDVVLPAGVVLTPYRLSAAAAAGVGEVAVHRAPRVAIVTTGDELVPAGRRVLGRGQIPESNSVLLAAAVPSGGGEVVAIVRVGDDPARFLAELDRVVAEASADVVVCTGGVSAGEHDVVKAALAPGGEIAFRSVSMQPGKPQAFGRLASGALLFGLPGNPVSVAVSFEVFVRPALRALQGLPPTAAPPRTVEVAAGWRPADGRRQYMPVRFDLDGRIRPATAGGSGSHLSGGLAAAEGFAIVEAGVPQVEPGDLLPVLEVVS